MTFRLETDRLILRQFKESDLDAFLAYRNDPDVARYQGWETPYSRARATRFVQNMLTANPRRGQWLQLALELRATGEMIGDVAFLIKREDDRQALIGYSLAQTYWGHGYAFEALSGLLRYLFDELKFHRVTAECDVENIASWKLLEKLGFRREAHLIENLFFKGAYESEYHYAMLSREWKERNSSRQGETEAAGDGNSYAGS
jgi:RimJ/RimL family protein N-acetyltransferase